MMILPEYDLFGRRTETIIKFHNLKSFDFEIVYTSQRVYVYNMHYARFDG